MLTTPLHNIVHLDDDHQLIVSRYRCLHSENVAIRSVVRKGKGKSYLKE